MAGNPPASPASLPLRPSFAPPPLQSPAPVPMHDPSAPPAGQDSPIVTPPTKRRNTYESLLNAFGAERSPESVTKARRSVISTNLPTATLRTLLASPEPLPTLPYAEAAGSPKPSAPALTTPAEMLQQTPPPARALRPRREVNYADAPGLANGGPTKEKKKLIMSDMLTSKPSPKKPPTASARAQIRSSIELNTTVKRDTFLYRHSEYFLPLLPEKNHVERLVEKRYGASVPYRELDEQPRGVTATLKSHQLSGLSFLAYMYDNGMPCMLGDEMGLGKTLQTLALFQLLEERQTSRSAENRPYLVVCPLSVVNSWVNEATRWTPQLKVLRFHGPKAERDALKKIATGQTDRYGKETNRSRKRTGDRRRAFNKVTDLDGDDDEDSYKIIVTSYEIFVAEQSWFKTAFVWRYIVLDEGHRIKNSRSNMAQALQNISAEYRLILTGTPLQNDLHEVWSLLHWLLPKVFTKNTADLFRNAFNLTQGHIDTSVMNHCRQLLELLMLRRMKNSAGVELDLPPKEEVLLYVPLTPLQRFWYLRLLTRSGEALLNELFAESKDKEKESLKNDVAEEMKIKALEEVDEQMAGGKTIESDAWRETRDIMMQNLANERQEQRNGDWTRLMNLIMQLRKCCNHPYLLPGVQPEPYALGDHVVRASGKFIVLEKLLRELVMKRGKKVIMFSGFTSTLDLCEDLLGTIGGGESFRYLRFDGSTERARRNLGIRLFNDKSTDYMVMLVSTRAGGLGINLTAATEAIFMDEDWNPQITLQAEARAHRIGQTQPVTIYKLCTQGTVEEQMMGRIRKKLYLSAKITEAMKNIHGTPASKRKRTDTGEGNKPNLNVSQLMTLVRRGAQTLSHPEIDATEMLSWDLDTMLEKCRDKPSDPKLGEDQVADEEAWLATMERVETAVFDGRRIQRKSNGDHSIAPRDLVRDDRRKGKETTVMIAGFAVSKESVNCGEWEAVPTLAGKDPRLAEPVRAKKKPIVNQDHCQACWDGGEIHLCALCPRSIHADCLTDDEKVLCRLGSAQFACPQHGCAHCGKRTSEAGGMLFRCRFCPLAYCEDCLDFDRAQLFGETLPELELLGFGAVRQAYWVTCHGCVEQIAERPEMRAFHEDHAREAEREWEEWREMRAAKRVKKEEVEQGWGLYDV